MTVLNIIIIISETRWLVDSIINAAQYMLQMLRGIPGVLFGLLVDILMCEKSIYTNIA